MAASKVKGQGRGRPRIEMDDMNEASNRRRERMRKAQHEFRTRQQATKEAQEQRIATLEDIIEQMGSVFGTFADSVLGLEMVRRDQDVMNDMHASMRRFVALGHMAQGTTAVSSASDIAGRHTVLEAGPSYHDGDVCDQERDRFHASSHGTLPRSGRSSSITTEYPPLSPNVFGNGWLGQLPANFAHFNESSQFNQLWTSEMHNLPLKLLQTTLNTAYYSLLGNRGDPTGLGRNMFRYALPHHSKEELLYNLRWFLGPGCSNMVLLGSACFTPTSTNEELDVFASHLLRPVIDSGVERTVYRRCDLNENPLAFLDAFGIENYLLARGARFTDPNTIEMSWRLSDTPDHVSTSNLQLPSNESLCQSDCTEARPTNLSQDRVVSLADVTNGTSLPRKAVMDMFSFNAITGNYGSDFDEASVSSRQEGFLWTKPHPSVRRQIISVSKLLEELARISACLSSGPGYELRLIENAIMLSTF